MKVIELHKIKNELIEVNIRSPDLPVDRYVKKIDYFLNCQTGQTIMDFGCGDGKVTALLADMYPEVNFVGFDYSQDFIDFAKKKYQKNNLSFFSVDLVNEDFPVNLSLADSIFSWGVIYYINPCNLENVQSKLFKQLKLNGKIIHFQIPKRFGSHSLSLTNRRVRAFSKFKMFFKSCFSNKYGEFSYQYSINDIFRTKLPFREIVIFNDDFFKDRFSVIYFK